MQTIRRSIDRGHANRGWLDSYHSFSFGDYHDPNHMGFRHLRVINEDRIAAERGFDTHPHRDMEIVTYVLDGTIAHKDSLGNGSTILPGEVQRLSAGTGITHSEFNPSTTESCHFLQIWIVPDQGNLAPSYEQKGFSLAQKKGKLCLVASPQGEAGSVVVHQDMRLYVTILDAAETVGMTLQPDRHYWVQVVRGQVVVQGNDLRQGDAIALSEEMHLTIVGAEGQDSSAEVLVFELT
jgi:quercetin 2,3-dioxygenase